MKCTLTMVVASFVCIAQMTHVLCVSADDPVDPIDARLVSAKNRYKKAIDELDKSVNELMQKKQETARKAGDKKSIQRLLAELEIYKEGGVVPPSLPISYGKKQLGTRRDLEEAYQSAIKDYTKKSADANAQKIEQELKDFQNAPALAAIKRELIGTWTLRVSNGYTSDLVFKEDGTVLHTTSGSTLKWRVDIDAGWICLGDTNISDRMKLPLKLDGTAGKNSGGSDMTVKKVE